MGIGVDFYWFNKVYQVILFCCQQKVNGISHMFFSLLSTLILYWFVCYFFFSLAISLYDSYSFLFLQLYHSFWGAAVSQLPPGVRQQYALCVADHLQPREQNQSGLQRSQHGETVWLPLHQGWGKGSVKIQAVVLDCFEALCATLPIDLPISHCACQ